MKWCLVSNILSYILFTHAVILLWWQTALNLNYHRIWFHCRINVFSFTYQSHRKNLLFRWSTMQVGWLSENPLGHTVAREWHPCVMGEFVLAVLILFNRQRLPPCAPAVALQKHNSARIRQRYLLTYGGIELITRKGSFHFNVTKNMHISFLSSRCLNEWKWLKDQRYSAFYWHLAPSCGIKQSGALNVFNFTAWKICNRLWNTCQTKWMPVWIGRVSDLTRIQSSISNYTASLRAWTFSKDGVFHSQFRLFTKRYLTILPKFPTVLSAYHIKTLTPVLRDVSTHRGRLQDKSSLNF